MLYYLIYWFNWIFRKVFGYGKSFEAFFIWYVANNIQFWVYCFMNLGFNFFNRDLLKNFFT